MKARFFVVVALVCLVAAVARLDSQMSASHSAVEMTGVKAAIKLQTPVEGFFAPLNGKLDLTLAQGFAGCSPGNSPWFTRTPRKSRS